MAADKSDYARQFRAQLVQKVMPYWCDTAIDGQRGGYLLADDLKGRGEARDKQLVTQSRMVWGFSHAHLHKLGDGQHDYLKAAQNGYRFLLDHFKDKVNGGRSSRATGATRSKWSDCEARTRTCTGWRR